MRWRISSPDSGVCVDLEGRQIAVFRVDEWVYAIGNHDPASGANVLSRGIVGDIGGELVVASPIYKQHFSLATGRCLEEPDFSCVPTLARLLDGQVWVAVEPSRQRSGRSGAGWWSIGNGMAGMRTVEELLELAPHAYEITVFGAEPHGNYNRILLSPVLAGEKKVHEIMLHPPSGITITVSRLHAGDPVVAIDRRRRRVRSACGVEVAYDRLLIATGSTPMVLPVPGSDSARRRDLPRPAGCRCHARRRARSYDKAVVIGGGLLGLEAASGLRRRGMDVTVVHLPETLMERQLDRAAAQLLQSLAGETRPQVQVVGQNRAPFWATHERSGVRLRRRRRTGADLVVMATGVRPNIELAKPAGLRCDRGILVDDTLLTFDPSVYAVGECVQHRNTHLRPGGAAVGAGRGLCAPTCRSRSDPLSGVRCSRRSSRSPASICSRPATSRERNAASPWYSPTPSAASTSTW